MAQRHLVHAGKRRLSSLQLPSLTPLGLQGYLSNSHQILVGYRFRVTMVINGALPIQLIALQLKTGGPRVP